MAVRGFERIKNLYIIWTIISIVILYFLFNSQYSSYLIWIVFLLLVKDLLIDLYAKKGPTPGLLEHAPFVIIIAIIGLLGIFEVEPFIGLVSPDTAMIAIIDGSIDVLDDFRFFE